MASKLDGLKPSSFQNGRKINDGKQWFMAETAEILQAWPVVLKPA